MQNIENKATKNLESKDALVLGFKSNDRKCLEKIYLMQYPTVESYILKNSGMKDDAKDIFQEAMIAAWLNIREDKFQPKSADSLGGYIFQIAKYKWLDKLKSKTHKQTVRLVKDASDRDVEDISQADLQEERSNYLKTLYQQLDQKCKSILNRFYYQKLSLEEIGKELSYDPATIKTLKYRCMKKLRAVHISKSNSKK